MDLPSELVSAHADGRLVLFVGAGASVAPPSSLPTFSELAQRIADDSQIGYSDEDLMRPDELLGRIDNGNVDVNRRVSDLIGSADSQPNELHEAIVDLARASREFRIVTTNYDSHLSASLPAGVDQFEAPALPLGNDFRGLVYLHGSVRQDPSRLVVTDADFGSAYVSEPWAAPFLSRLFEDFAALFVGYGLNDTLMKYLVRSLSSKAEVYALADKPENGRWLQYGVVPVGYQDHDRLPGLVRQWADNARMGMLDHDRRVCAIVASAPPLSLEDESYLDAVVTHPERVGLFARHARGVAWLRWMSSRPQFKSLFDPQASFGRTEHDLKPWFAEHYAANPEHAGDAMRVVAKNGGQINRELWFAVVQSLSHPVRIRSEPTDRWIPLLAQTMPPGCNEWLGMLLRECELPRDRDASLVLLDRIFEPRMQVDRLDSGRMEIVAGTEESWLESAAMEWLGSHRAAIATDLAPVLDRHLRRFHRLTKMIGSSEAVWRLRGHGRIAIESRERGDDCGADVLIDMARDVLEALIADAPDIAGGYMRAWSEHEWAILRRLAVHGWVMRQDRSAAEKLRWLQESDLLLDCLLQPEVMRLLKVVLLGASPDSVEMLVSRVCGSREHNERYAYVMLSWIAEHAPESAAASEALADLQASHPDWRPLRDPDFPRWSMPLPAEDLMEPLELQGLHDRIAADPEAAVKGLINEKEQRARRGVDWADALDSLFSTVVEHAEDGAAVLEVLTGEPTASWDLERELGEAVLNGWTHTMATGSLTDEQCTHITGFLPDVWRLGRSRWGHGKLAHREPGWMPGAESHWAGMTAGLWIEGVLAERRSAADGWLGLSDSAQAALEEMIGGDTKASHYAQVAVAARLNLLFNLDEAWTLCNVLPLLDPSADDHRAVRCWEGYLGRRRADERLLQAGLLAHFVAMAPRVEGLSRRSPGARSSFAQMAASLCVDSSIDPVDDGWLPKFVAATDIESRVAWVQSMARRLSGLSVDATDAHWAKWMHRYWEDRLASIPVAMTQEEASAMAEWSVLLGSSYSEAVDLVLQSPANLSYGSRLLPELADLGNLRDERPPARPSDRASRANSRVVGSPAPQCRDPGHGSPASAPL